MHASAVQQLQAKCQPPLGCYPLSTSWAVQYFLTILEIHFLQIIGVCVNVWCGDWVRRSSTAYEGTLHIYSYRAIIEMDIQNQLWLFCICTYTLALGAASPSLSNGTSFQVCCLHLCPGTRAPLGRGDGRAASLRKDDLTQMSAAPPHLNFKT